jgi:hypothetical protein
MVGITAQADRGAAPTAQGSLISLFSLSKQKLLGKVLKGISCSALLRFKEDASQAAARKG